MYDRFERTVKLEYVIDYSYIDAVGELRVKKESHDFYGTINELHNRLDSYKRNFPYEVSVTFVQRKAVVGHIKITLITRDLLKEMLDDILK